MPSDDGTRLTCPDCGGGLFEVAERGISRLRCSVEHVFSPESFLDAHGLELERALWTASHTLDDRAVLLERMSTRARTSGQQRSAAAFARQARDVRDHASVIRASMPRHEDAAPEPDGEPAGRATR